MILIDLEKIPNYKYKVMEKVGDKEIPREFRIAYWEDIENMPTVNVDDLPIVRELRNEIDRLTNDGKQDLWAVERKRREEVEEELRREKNICDNLREKLNKLAKERYEAVNKLHGYCPSCKNYTANHMEGPCENCKHEYYKYRDVGAVDNWEWCGPKKEE